MKRFNLDYLIVTREQLRGVDPAVPPMLRNDVARAEIESEPAFHAPCSIPGCDHEEPPLESPLQDLPRSETDPAQTAANHAQAPRFCASCSRALDAWQLRFDGGAELRCGRSDCAAKDKLVASREVQADGTIRETAANHARDADAPNRLNKTAYSGLVAEDIAWLEAQPRTLERDHVIMIVRASAGREYPARAHLDLAALRTLAREAKARCYGGCGPATCVGAYEGQTADEYACDECCGHGNEDGHCRPVERDHVALASAVERLCDALEAKAQPRAHLDADELAIIEQTRALVRGRDELRAVLTAVGFPQQGGEDLAVTFRRAWEYCVETAHKAQEAQGKAETERDSERADNERLRGAAANYEDLLDVLGAIYGVDATPGEVESAARRSRDAFEATEAKRDAALAQIERVKPVVEAACAWHRWVSDPEPEADNIEPLENALDEACEAYQPVMPKPPIGGAS